MMELSGVSEVLQRISEIETKIGMKHTAPAVGFSQELQQAMKNSNGTASGQTVAAVSAGNGLRSLESRCLKHTTNKRRTNEHVRCKT